MLPRTHHTVDSADFTAAIRQGTRVGNSLVIVHVRADEEHNNRLVGFVVLKREIKHINERSYVKRRLRHLICKWTADLLKGARVVVRTLSKALGVPSKKFGEHLDCVMV